MYDGGAIISGHDVVSLPDGNTNCHHGRLLASESCIFNIACNFAQALGLGRGLLPQVGRFAGEHAADSLRGWYKTLPAPP